MRKLLWLLPLLLLALVPALAEEAADVTADCTIVYAGKTMKPNSRLTDDNYTTGEVLKPGEYAEITCSEPMSGVMVRFHDVSDSLTVQLPEGDGWVDDVTVGTHLTDWMGFSRETDRFRLVNTSKRKLKLAELNMYGSGERPASVHVWNDCEKADLMLVVGHPDDDLLWFGGLLPMYAGERGLHVVVVYAHTRAAERRLELLEALWTCGVHDYPCLLTFSGTTHSLSDTYRFWGKEKVFTTFTGVIRRYRPDVVITQAVSGEYGHGAHKLVADAIPKCAEMAADPEQYPDQGEAWQVQKIYLHLWPENAQHFNWHVPLKAFGGEDAYSVATRALLCHRSQTKAGFWTMHQGEKEHNDNTLFGLKFTLVGPDTVGGDLFENLPQSVLSQTV